MAAEVGEFGNIWDALVVCFDLRLFVGVFGCRRLGEPIVGERYMHVWANEVECNTCMQRFRLIIQNQLLPPVVLIMFATAFFLPRSLHTNFYLTSIFALAHYQSVPFQHAHA